MLGLCVLRGLHNMHAGGYAHLDIKPENIGLAEEGNLASAMLMDYGSADPVGAALVPILVNDDAPASCHTARSFRLIVETQ